LAEKLGVSRVHVANVESPDDAPHHRTPSLATLEKLARVFRVRMAELLG
jgi:transcriptional regulator with XRE-family HTH domain